MTTLTRRNLVWLGFGLVLATSVAAYAQQSQSAKESGLPYWAGADVWVDQSGKPPAVVPGIQPGQLEKMRVLVFRPRTNGITLDTYAVLFVEQGLLNATQQPVLKVAQLPQGENQNREESFLFKAAPDQYLVLGFITNVNSGNQLVYSVILDGKLNQAAALLQARSSVTGMAERARSQRLTPAPPAGSVAVGATNRLSGARLPQLLQAIVQNPRIPERVKALSRVVIPQSISVSSSKWRTPAPLKDEAFVDYYVAQAARMGWGQAVVKDLQPGLPTLLFQIPDGGGVVMVRGQLEPATALTPAGTGILVLVMEGRIDVSALTPKPN
jgi:hypothetical protein